MGTNDWSKYRVRDVVLLGGAADADDEDWPECAKRIRGKIYCAWSPADRVLRGIPDLRRPVGRHGISGSHPKIVNRRYQLGHGEYWDNLEYLLSRLWPRFRQAAHDLVATMADVECPYCGEDLQLEPPWDDTPHSCGNCGLDFEFDGKATYYIHNDIECPECGQVESRCPEADYIYYCGACETPVWEYGDRMR